MARVSIPGVLGQLEVLQLFTEGPGALVGGVHDDDSSSSSPRHLRLFAFIVLLLWDSSSSSRPWSVRRFLKTERRVSSRW